MVTMLRNDVCDFHAHVLPRADHGSSSVENSMRQLSLANKCGVSRIVATPHFYPHKMRVDDFIEKRNKSYEELERYIPDNMSIRLGAEVLLCDNIENLPDVEQLCIGGSNILLLELPFSNYTDTYTYSVSALMEKGINILLAHVERYDPIMVNEFIALGAKAQINANAFSGLFSIDKCVLDWLDSGCVAAIGSDIHGVDKRAYENYAKSFKKIKKYIGGIIESSDKMWNEFVPYRELILV